MLQNLKLGPEYDGFLFLAESARNPPSLRSHHHRELELNLVARGSVTYVAGGRRMTFPARTLMWMFPAQEHQLVDRTRDAQYFVAVFKPELLAQACRGEIYRGLKRKRLPSPGLLHTVLDPETFDFLRRFMARVMEGSLDSDILNREAGFGVSPTFRYQHSDPDGLNAGLRHLLLSCWRLQAANRSEAEGVRLHPAVAKALELLSDQDWDGSLELLAGKCGLSPAHFCRVFSRQTGVSLSAYRNALRLARFWEIHRRPVRTTLAEAIFSAGFGSYAQFYKVFAAAYGRGPRSWIRGEFKSHAQID